MWYDGSMAWQWGLFRGKRVLARVTSAGVPDVREGRIDIRFKLGAPTAYPARARNVALLAGATVEDDVEVVPPAPATGKGKAGGHPLGDAGAPAHGAASLDGRWSAYTDGACTGNPGPAGSGLVLLDAAGTLVREAYRYLGTATNNIAELTAVEMVYDHLPSGESVVVHTDSKYAIGVLTKGWKAKANAELVARVRAVVAARPTRMQYVPGHSGYLLNERADELAREAIATRRSSG